MRSEVVEQIEAFFEIDRETLLEQGVEAFLQDRQRQLQLDRHQILARYRVASAAELNRCLEEGSIDDHPAWEDLITVENLDDAIRTLDGYLRELQTAT